MRCVNFVRARIAEWCAMRGWTERKLSGESVCLAGLDVRVRTDVQPGRVPAWS